MDIKTFCGKNKYDLNDLVSIVRLLRDPDKGCPWDKEQTHESIRKNFIEETYEVCEAIDNGDKALLLEELGDVLLQVALHAEMERGSGGFDIGDVADGICKKLILRHPHVFGDVTAESSGEVLKNWEAIKRAEKGQRAGSDAIASVPKSLPALMRAQKTQKRAADAGFDYPTCADAADDLECETRELRAALFGNGDVAEEIGDVIFSAVNVARLSKLDAEETLTKATEKFTERYARVEKIAAERGINMLTASLEILNMLWAKAKEEV